MEFLSNLFLNALGLTADQQRLIMRTAWFGVVSFHIVWVCGWLGVVGLTTPFARADSVEQIVADLRNDRIERLDHEILNLRIQQCQATTAEAKRNYGERLQELVLKYYAISQRQPRVPGCDEL